MPAAMENNAELSGLISAMCEPDKAKATAAHLRQVIQAAAEDAYEQEVVLTEMERHILGGIVILGAVVLVLAFRKRV